MAIERTLSIIKPDAVAKNVIGQIYSRFEGAGLKVVAARMAQLSRQEAEGFYAVHAARPFFKDLVEFMNWTEDLPQSSNVPVQKTFSLSAEENLVLSIIRNQDPCPVDLLVSMSGLKPGMVSAHLLS